jgi:hypothetical protein
MGDIIDVIERQFDKQMRQQWYETYWLIDMHGVIIRPNHKDDLPNRLDFYPFALDSLVLLTNRSDIRMILYTCSYDYQIRHYINLLRLHHIEFDYINENPEIGEGDVGCYDAKPYFDVYLDDKAGFNAEVEWRNIHDFLREDKRPDERWRNPIRERRKTNYLLEQESKRKCDCAGFDHNYHCKYHIQKL